MLGRNPMEARFGSGLMSKSEKTAILQSISPATVYFEGEKIGTFETVAEAQSVLAAVEKDFMENRVRIVDVITELDDQGNLTATKITKNGYIVVLSTETAILENIDSDINNILVHAGQCVKNNSSFYVFAKPDSDEPSPVRTSVDVIPPGGLTYKRVDGLNINGKVYKITNGYNTITINPNGSYDTNYTNLIDYMIYFFRGGEKDSSWLDDFQNGGNIPDGNGGWTYDHQWDAIFLR
jgi:uncharacterized Fe-S cluster protein YjdI